MFPKIVFMGSPDFALPSLETLVRSFNVVGVVTQPDRPAGRGRYLKPPPVKELALAHNLPLIQPKTLRDQEAISQLNDWQPEIIVVTAFGHILRKSILELAPHGCVNVHASLLPRWRGAAPINAVILKGDLETGTTIMKMDAGIDTGPIIAQRATKIGEEETAGELSKRLATMGGELLGEVLPDYIAGKIQSQPQDNDLATYAPMLSKSDGELDFTKPAKILARQVRAYSPWPGSFVKLKDGALKVHKANAGGSKASSPGTQVKVNGFPAIQTGEGTLVLDIVQPPGKKNMSGKDYLRGGV